MSLKNYSNGKLELVIDELSGEVFATQKALGRMCKVADTTIMRWGTAASVDLKTAEVLTGQGLRTAALYDIKSITKAVMKYNPELAEEFMELGATLVLQRLVNFEMSSHSVMTEVDKVVAKMRELHKPAHNSMQAATSVLKVQSDTLAMTCVQAVTGCSYKDVMDGVEYRSKYSPDLLPDEEIEKLTNLKHQFVNMKLTNTEKTLSGRDRCISLVRRACIKAGIDCLV